MSNVHTLDTKQLGRSGIIAVTALELNDGIALFDTGPASTFDNIANELSRIGVALSDVRHVFLSPFGLRWQAQRDTAFRR